MKRPIYVVGSANLDLVFRCARFPNPGETLLGGSFTQFSGGKGANQAAAIGKLGGDVRFVGAVGSDGFGTFLLEGLCSSNVDTRHVEIRNDVASGSALILVDDSAENMIVVAEGANGRLSTETVAAALEHADQPYILAQLEIPLDAVLTASEFGRFILNPAPARSLPDALLAKCFAITPNETETEILTGINPSDVEACREAARAFVAKGVANVVLTLGARGCYWSNADEEYLVPPPGVEPVDTTAAGDAFNGALVLALSRGDGWHDALYFANAVAALSTTKAGAQAAMPTVAELEEFLHTQR